MMQPSLLSLRATLYAGLSRLVLVSALSTVGLLASYTPSLMSRSSTLGLGDAAYAQSPTPPVSQYARAALLIEQQRQQDHAEVKRIMGGNVPEDVCRQQNIPSAVRDICDRFLKRSAEIIKGNGLTISQFNEITRRKEGDPALQQQIQGELLKLQKATP
ncbi:MAG: DUF4168 domain-containing protein [Stenomitos frigidus ULC029]